MKKSTSNSPVSQDNNVNLRENINKYLRYWPWFAISIILTIVIANVYLYYAPNTYQTTASILIKDEQNANTSQIAVFQDLGLASGLKGVNLENEIEILTSRVLTERMVRKLKLNIRYYFDEKVRSIELFENNPINLQVLSNESEWPNKISDLVITPTSSTSFTISQEEKEQVSRTFGQEFEYEGVRYLINSTEKLMLKTPTRVSVSSIPSTIDRYRSSIKVALQGKQSSVITMNLVSETPKKSEEILNELIDLFNQDAIQDRSIVSKNTAQFIDERIDIVWNELDSVELSKVRYKETHSLIDLQAEGDISLRSASESNQQLLAAQTELSQINAMISYLETGKQSSLLPSSLGVSDSGLMGLIQQYNEMVMQRNQLLIHSTDTHPTVVSLTSQLVQLKANVLESLRSARSSLDIKLKDLLRQERRIGGQLARIPLKERDFTTIERQQEIKQTLYLYLLQKREEASISSAVIEPKAKIVDAAFTPVKPISPKSKLVLLGAFMIGGLIPFGTIYLGSILDNKIRHRKDITTIIPDASILAEIPELSKKESYTIVEKNDLGILAESFRVLRTNLKFTGVLSKRENGKSIIVTSSIKGEGKTLVSVNLATTLTHAGYKVLLIGADIRNPQLHKFLPKAKNDTAQGFVEYLVNENSTLEDYIVTTKKSESLNIIHSGAIPPNPAELLLSDRVNAMVDEAKAKFDYVIIDTAPTLLVTDTLLLSEFADATLYVVRAGHTKKQILEFAKEIKDKGKLKKVNFVLNDVSRANYGYGGEYGYGYGYTAKKKGFWRR